jgi:cell division protein FtsI/penicillin-binding protein 2
MLAGTLFFLSLVLAVSVIYAMNLMREGGRNRLENRVSVPLSPPPEEGPKLSQRDLAALLGSRELELERGSFFVIPGERELLVKTTLEPDLQAAASSWVNGSGALMTALVVMEPRTGRILAMAGSQDAEQRNTALLSVFPAASLFKIVTAAAALESGGLSADSALSYDGGKHTLYKNNVQKDTAQGNHSVTFKESFADSINSVFGKLGAHTLGADNLYDYANRFGFNRPIAFDLPLGTSVYPGDPLSDDTFRLAELASGYNRETLLSPVHGALLASMAINGGLIFEPFVVSEVFDRQNHIWYRGQTEAGSRVLSPEAASELAVMMQTTITSGTGRKKFYDSSSHPVLSQLTIGGKSGSINDVDGNRVDWFVAYGQPKDEKSQAGALALAAVVVHSGYTNVVSQDLVRKAFLLYYDQRFSTENPALVVAGRKPGRN